ncbi:uncharacterized protein [Polyergus mexicanus]|uniref:uncharacterized protein n=1 Tax=Polyergus mexicanus TaxID=615972 RepID=UPI0038B4BB54
MLSHQIMGQLPPARSNYNVARPFWNAGVDYCGPFYVRDRMHRNSKQYKSADRELQALLHNKEFKESVLESTAAEYIVWHFIPAPHFGGLWKSTVRSMKLHLKRTVGNICLTEAEMTTVLTQVKAILNFRTLTPISDDPADLRALNPGHFLISENLMAYPESNLQDIPLNKLSR